MNSSFVRAVFAATLLCSTAVGTVILPATVATAADKVSHEVSKPLAEAQKLVQSGDLQGALAKVREAQALTDRTAFDDFTINQFLGAISIKLNDHATATLAYEAMAESPALPDEQKKAVLHDALLLSSEARHYPKTIAYGQQLEAINAMDDQTTTQVAIAYYNTGDVAHAQQYAQKAIDLAKAAGKQADPAMLQIVMNSQVKQNNQAGAEQTLEQLYQSSGDIKSFGELIDVSMSTSGMNDNYFLDLLRLKVLSGAAGGEDYTQLGNATYLQGYPGEAVNVLQQGMASGKVSGGKASETLRKSRADEAQDERQLPSIAASAARARGGQEAVKLAEAYWGYGRFADAEAAARQAIGKGGMKDAAEGPLLLGMSLVAQGKYDDGIQAFGQVGGNQAAQKTAHLWSLYAQAKKGPGTPAAAPAH